MKNELEQVLNDFISLAKTYYDRKGNEYLLEQLEVAFQTSQNIMFKMTLMKHGQLIKM